MGTMLAVVLGSGGSSGASAKLGSLAERAALVETRRLLRWSPYRVWVVCDSVSRRRV
jgi:hypothetical protein